MARGNERRSIYGDSADRERFLEVLALAPDRFDWRVLAYCLMSNHYHLLLQTPNANLARGMCQLNGVYAQSFNRRYGRDGHLFQGRYRARLVQANERLLATLRCIVRNPIRAGLCQRLEQWRWSSHLATIGAGPAGFIADEALLSFLGESRPQARARYLALVEAEEDPSPPSHPIIDGDACFVALHLERVRPNPEYPSSILRPPRPSLQGFVTSFADAAAIAHAYREHGYSMREIATHLCCGITTVHRRIRAHEQLR